MGLVEIKGRLAKCLVAYMCLAFLSINIAYASSMLPSMQSLEHEHSESGIGAETHQHGHQQQDNSTHHNISTVTQQADLSYNQTCSCCDDFYNGHMATIISSRVIHDNVVASRSLVISVQLKVSSFITSPDHPPPIYIS